MSRTFSHSQAFIVSTVIEETNELDDSALFIPSDLFTEPRTIPAESDSWEVCVFLLISCVIVFVLWR
jgi:hypothetical protein